MSLHENLNFFCQNSESHKKGSKPSVKMVMKAIESNCHFQNSSLQLSFQLCFFFRECSAGKVFQIVLRVRTSVVKHVLAN